MRRGSLCLLLGSTLLFEDIAIKKLFRDTSLLEWILRHSRSGTHLRSSGLQLVSIPDVVTQPRQFMDHGLLILVTCDVKAFVLLKLIQSCLCILELFLHLALFY